MRYVKLNKEGMEKLKDIPYFYDPEKGYRSHFQVRTSCTDFEGAGMLFLDDLPCAYPADLFEPIDTI